MLKNVVLFFFVIFMPLISKADLILLKTGQTACKALTVALNNNGLSGGCTSVNTTDFTPGLGDKFYILILEGTAGNSPVFAKAFAGPIALPGFVSSTRLTVFLLATGSDGLPIPQAKIDALIQALTSWSATTGMNATLVQ